VAALEPAPAVSAVAESKEGDTTLAAAAVPLQPTFYDVIANEASVKALLKDIMDGFGKITARPPGVAASKASEDEDLTTHKESFGNFGHLWQVDRGRWMARYAKVGSRSSMHDVSHVSSNPNTPHTHRTIPFCRRAVHCRRLKSIS